ncbi:hypothetical protein [Nocardia australiensis]|uniref:hypothetical protein n=1 Tax=Nocardia australiensis TaxID=2887191 RepID=UPI001D132B71|nr:hypothetical protein [Nocardia australiensis]
MAVKIAPMMMPDLEKIKKECPEYEFSPSLNLSFQPLIDTFAKYFTSYGEDEKGDPPEMPPPPEVTESAELAGIAEYAKLRKRMKDSGDQIYKSSKDIIKDIRSSGDKGDQAKSRINTVIDSVTGAASTPPPPPMSETEHIMTFMAEAYEAGAAEWQNASDDQKGPKAGIESKMADMEALISKMDKKNQAGLNDAMKKLQTQIKGAAPPDLTQKGPGSPDGRLTSTIPDIKTRPTALDDLDDTNKNPQLNPRTSQADDKLSNALDRIGPKDPSAPQITPPAAAGLGGMMGGGMGMGMDPSILSMIAANQAQRGMADRDLEGRRAELDPSRYDQPRAVVPPMVTAPPAQAQAAAAPAAAAAAANQAAAQSVSAPAQSTTSPVTAPPGRVPDEDGRIDYPFPDGRTQKVSPVVAQALDAAFDNKSGTDARGAYEKTTAKWKSSKDANSVKDIGEAVDPYKPLITGDIGVWENRCAVLVVFPPEEGGADGGTLEAIVDGVQTSIVGKTDAGETMSDSDGDLGAFMGFARPPGIEMTAPAGGTDSAVPVSDDQSVGMAVPAAAPAG